MQSLPDFTVVGIAGRTTNAKEMSGEGIIGPMWQRVASENLLERIPDRTDSNTIALYTEYDSDADGEYTFLIGANVNSTHAIPDGMVVKQIPAGHYSMLTSEQGPLWEVVPKVWQKIWSTPPGKLGGIRSFIADFEIYDARASDPANSIVEIWIGIR